MKVNLGILLSEKHIKRTVINNLNPPDETEILATLETYAKLKASDSWNKKSDPLAAIVPLNEPCTITWDIPHGREWYIVMTRKTIDEDSLVIEYLEHIDTNSSEKTWWYP